MEENTINNPLKIRWDALTFQYKVNKPNYLLEGQYVDLVDLSLAKEMLVSLEEMNVLIGHLKDDGAKLYSNDQNKIKRMQELILKLKK